jgi:hypothetical protein
MAYIRARDIEFQSWLEKLYKTIVAHSYSIVRPKGASM